MKSAFDPNLPFRPKSFPFFYGWWILVASSVGIVASIPGQTMGFSVFTEILSETLDLGPSVISTAYLFGTICGGLFLPKVGKWFDRFGARTLGTVVCLVMGIGLLYLSQVDRIASQTHVWMPVVPHSAHAFTAVTLGFFWLRFTGQGALTMTSRSMLGKWFNHYRGLALSISGVIVAFSFSLAPRFLDLLIQTMGWRWTWAGLGLVMMSVVVLFVWLFFRDNPEACGLQMDGKAPPSEKREKNQDLVIHREFTRGEALRTPAFWIFNLTLGLHSFAITGYTFHVVAIAGDCGISREWILQAFIPSSIIGILISLAGGVVNPFIRLKYILMVLPLGGILFSAGPAFGLEATLPMIVVGLGMAGGVFGLTSGLVWPRFFGRKHLGAIGGVNMATLVYGSASAPLIFSLSRDITGHFRSVFLGLVIMNAIALVTAWFADNPQRKLVPSRPNSPESKDPGH